jgi:dTDP-4-dehydrorhamnose 3,5-epimerase
VRRLETRLPGLVLLAPDVYGDDRGWFMEAWNRRRYAEAGVDVDFVQDNLSYSRRGVLRGLHFQHPHAQGKLVQVLEGEVWDVAVDIRRGSPTWLRWEGVHLSAAERHQLYVPPGFAHGFCVLSETALFAYKCTELYRPEHDRSIRYDDPEIAIDWPVTEPELSGKDAAGRTVAEMPPGLLPEYAP